jgi:hypothetical protein
MKFTLGLLIGLLVGCASVVSGQLRFQDRELLIHPDKAALSYPYQKTVCVQRAGIGRLFGKKCESVQTFDNYDMTDATVRKSIIDAGFTCTSPMRFKY